ncbi:ABC-2 type transport system permease protein [Paenibacillus sp. DS2015]|uniref:ABC transporter permease n=1 Tax=Paenibacillus sp. DS2015 TaxID=3373917 RepID=UPI003D23368F
MFNLMKADLYKLRKSTAIQIFLGIMCLSAVLVTVISYLLAQGRLGMEISGTASLLSDAAMVSIIGSIIAGIFICGDFENKTIHNAVLCGTGRGTVMVAKALVYFFVIALMVLPYSVITGIAFCTGYEFGTPFVASVFLDILANESGLQVTLPLIVKLCAIMLTMMIVYAAQLSICVLLAFVLKKKPVLVVGIGVIVSMLLAQATLLKESYPSWGTVFSYTPFAIGYPPLMTLDAAPSDFIKAILVSLVFIAIMLAITYITFRRTELK